jgi:excisionase family DNA binding protein
MADRLNENDLAHFERGDVGTASDSVVLLRAIEVARLLGLSRSQIYLMMADRRLPSVRIGRAVRVPKRALAEWIRLNTARMSGGAGQL